MEFRCKYLENKIYNNRKRHWIDLRNFINKGYEKCKIDDIKWAADWQKGPCNKIWKVESDAYFKTSLYVEAFLNCSVIYHKR